MSWNWSQFDSIFLLDFDMCNNLITWSNDGIWEIVSEISSTIRQPRPELSRTVALLRFEILGLQSWSYNLIEMVSYEKL